MERPTRRRRSARRRRPKGPMGRLLISPDFALLWLKQSITALCDALFTTTLIIWLGVTGHTPLSLGVVLGAMGAAYVLIGPFAEAATERWSRRKTMFVTDVVRGICTFLLMLTLLPTFTPKRELAAICLLCFVIGLMSRFSLAAQRSALNAVVPPSEHPRGISRIQGSVALMTILGPILAAIFFLLPLLVFPQGNPLLGLLATGFLLLLSAGGAQAMDRQFTTKMRAIQARRKRQRPEADGESLPDVEDEQAGEESWSPSVLRSGIADWGRSIRLVLQQRPFGRIASIAALVAFAGGVVNVLEVFFVSRYLSEPGAYVGLIVSANAAGVLLGSVLFRHLDAHLRPATTFLYGVLGLGLATTAFVTTHSFSEALVWAALMGFANGILLLAAQTALVETEEYDRLPRLFVGYDTLTSLLSLAGILLGGLAGRSLKVSIVLSVSAGLLMLGGLLAWLALSRASRFSTSMSTPSEPDEVTPQDEDADSYESLDEEAPAQADASDQDQEQEPNEAQPTPRPSRQFGRLWGSPAAPADQFEQPEQSYNANGYDDQYQEDESDWQPAAPAEEAPMPRRTMRLRPKPWEQGGSGGTGW
jgi:MFS family permease